VSRSIRYILFAALLVTPLLVHYWPFLFQGRCYASSDHHLFFEPFCRFIGDSYKLGQLPLWNPYLYFGMPQLALPSPSFLYPPSLLYAIQSYSQAVSTQQILHHVVAAVGGALLAESLGLSFSAAACAGMAYAFSGYMFTLSANYSLVAGASWLPLALFSSRRIRFADTRQTRSLWTMILAICVFLMVSAGRPEVFVPVVVIVFAHAVTSIGRHYMLKFRSPSQSDASNQAGGENPDPAAFIKDEKPLKVFLCRILALLLGGMLCMPLLLPALEWASTSNRAKGLDPNEVMIWSANWYSFATMLLAQPFGDLQTLGNGFLPAAADRAAYMPFLPSAYVGAGVITLALLGIFHTRSPWLVPVALLFTVGAAFSSGRYTPVLPWLIDTFPFLSVFRYPVKLLVLPIMALCLLAAFGFQAGKDNRIANRALHAMAILWAFVLLGGLGSVLIGKYWLTAQSVKLSISSEIAIALGAATVHAGAIGLTMVAICVLRKKGFIENFSFAAFTTALLAMDLLGTALRFPPLSAPPSFIADKPALVRMLEKQTGKSDLSKVRLINMYYDPLSIPAPVFAGGPKERTLNYYRFCRDLLVSNSNVDYRVPEAYGYEGTVTGKYRRLVLGLINDVRNAIVEETPVRHAEKVVADSIYDERMRRYISASGLQYAASQIYRDQVLQPELSREDFDIVEEDRNLNLRLYKVKRPKPRVELVDNWTWVKNNEQAYRSLSLEEKPQIDLPLIEKIENQKADYPQGFITENSKLEPSCELLVDKHDHVTVAVNTPRPCMLILRDQFYPGWKARLDSIGVPIYRANGFTRAVYITRGAHAIEFDYQPQSLKYGLRAALAAICIMVILAYIAFASSVWRFVKWTAGQK
jgi:hypothetical protein